MTQERDEQGKWVDVPEMGADRMRALRTLPEVLADIDKALVDVGATSEQREEVANYVQRVMDPKVD